MSHSEPYLGYEGLNKLTVSELKQGDQLFAMLSVKLQSLNPRLLQTQLLEERIRFLMDILREALANRYHALSLGAYAHILVALDYFLKVKDEIPDTHPDGFLDDYTKLEWLFKNFQKEFDDYKRWKTRQP